MAAVRHLAFYGYGSESQYTSLSKTEDLVAIGQTVPEIMAIFRFFKMVAVCHVGFVFLVMSNV